MKSTTRGRRGGREGGGTHRRGKIYGGMHRVKVQLGVQVELSYGVFQLLILPQDLHIRLMCGEGKQDPGHVLYHEGAAI
jgi:hypothetical protein